MLKIKDDADLKELEKYGFASEFLCYIKPIKRESFIGDFSKNIFVDELTRIIHIQEGLFNVDLELDTLYDLIKADLVEKVEEK